MDRIMGNRRLNTKAIFSFSNLDKNTQAHLKNVYSTLAIGLLAAAVGSYVHLFTSFMRYGLLTALGSIGLLLCLLFTSHTRENLTLRMGLFGGFAFLTGLSLGPLMEAVTMIDSSIVPTAFLATSVIFICFTLSALLTKQRTFLYLGGFLMSALSIMLIMSLVNIFARSQFIYTVELYMGLAVFCLFVLYDTQLIVEKRRMGDDDFIWHALDLFIDFIEIFRHLMVILAKKNNNKNND